MTSAEPERPDFYIINKRIAQLGTVACGLGLGTAPIVGASWAVLVGGVSSLSQSAMEGGRAGSLAWEGGMCAGLHVRLHWAIALYSGKQAFRVLA